MPLGLSTVFCCVNRGEIGNDVEKWRTVIYNLLGETVMKKQLFLLALTLWFATSQALLAQDAGSSRGASFSEVVKLQSGLFGVTGDWLTEQADVLVKRAFPAQADRVKMDLGKDGLPVFTLSRGDPKKEIAEEWTLTFGRQRLAAARVVLTYPSPRFSPDEIQTLISRQLLEKVLFYNREPAQSGPLEYAWSDAEGLLLSARVTIEENGSAQVDWIMNFR